MKEKANLNDYPELNKGKTPQAGELFEIKTEARYTLRGKSRGTGRPQELYLVAGKSWQRIHSIEKDVLDELSNQNFTIPLGTKITFEQWEKTHFGHEYTHLHLLKIEQP